MAPLPAPLCGRSAAEGSFSRKPNLSPDLRQAFDRLASPE